MKASTGSHVEPQYPVRQTTGLDAGSANSLVCGRGKALAICVFLLCALHLFVRLNGLNIADFDQDEALTWHFSKHLASSWGDVLLDVHPPTYVLLISAWQKIFGESETALRLPSVIFSLLTLLTLMMYSTMLENRQRLKYVIFVSLIFCLLPYEIHLARYARSYSMLTFFCTAFAYCYYRLVIYEERKFAMFSILMGAAAVYTHFQASIFLFSVLLSCLFCSFNRSTVATSVRVTVGIGILCIPLLLLLPLQSCLAAAIAAYSPARPQVTVGDFAMLFSPRSQGFDYPSTDYGLLDYLGLAVIVCAGMLLIAGFKRIRSLPLTCALMAQLVLIIAILYLAPLKLIHAKSICIMLPPVLVLVALTLAQSTHRAIQKIGIACIVGYTAVSLASYPYPRSLTTVDWRMAWSQLTPLLAKSASPVLIVSPSLDLLAMQYYMSRGIIKNPPPIWVECPNVTILLDPWAKELDVNLITQPGARSPNGKITFSGRDFWPMICRIFQEEKGLSDIFFLRIGTGDLIKPARAGKGFPVKQLCRSGLRSLYHVKSADRAWCTLFDSEYYLRQNPDVAEVGVSPLAHFLEWGAQEKRNPHPLFDVAYYMRHNPDVAETGVNPLVHFLEHGAREKRNPNPCFDVGRYMQENPDVVVTGVNPLVHYLEHGGKQRKCKKDME